MAAAVFGALKLTNPSDVAYADLPKVHVCVDAFKLNGSPWTDEQIDTLVSGANDIWARANINITWNGTLYEIADPLPPPAGAGTKGDIRSILSWYTNAETAEAVNEAQTAIRVTSVDPFQVGHEIRINSEYMMIEALSGTEIIVDRPQDGSGPFEHPSGSSIAIRGDSVEHGVLFETAPTVAAQHASGFPIPSHGDSPEPSALIATAPQVATAQAIGQGEPGPTTESSSTPALTPTSSLTESPTPPSSPTETEPPTSTPTETPTLTPTYTPSHTPTQTATHSPSPTAAPSWNCVRVFFINDFVDNLGKPIGAWWAYASGTGLDSMIVNSARGKPFPPLLAHELGHVLGLPHPNPSKPGNLMNSSVPQDPTLNETQIAAANASAQGFGQVKPGPKPTIRPSSTPTSTSTSTPMPSHTPTSSPTQIPTRTPADTPTPIAPTVATRSPTFASRPTNTPAPTGTSPRPLPFGDTTCDGVVNAVDALFILQRDAGMIARLPCEDGADVNLDGLVDALDALLVLQFVAGMIGTLPPPGVAGVQLRY